MRSFLYSFKRYKVSFLLNVLSLSVAFSVFYILMVQVNFEWGFDSFHKDADRIYRFEVHTPDRKNAVFSYPMLHEMISCTPYIENAGIWMYPRGGSINKPGEDEQRFIPAQFCWITPGYAKVFTFDMIEGTVDSLQNAEFAVIPLSLAEKVYGKRKSYLNEEFGDGQSWSLRVGGVYRDFPKNSMLGNFVYQIPNESWMTRFLNDWEEASYYAYFKLKENVDPKHLFDNVNVRDGSGNTVNLSKEQQQEGYSLYLRPLKDIYYTNDVVTGDIALHGNRGVNRLLFSIAILIVVIAGINFMNFSVALVPTKIKSINTRMVLGESVSQLRFSLVKEAVFLAVLSFLLSLLIVFLISRTTFVSFLDGDMRLPYQGGLIAVSLFVALVTGVLSSIYPAYYITSFPPAMVVKGSFALSPQGRMLRNWLIGLQFTVSLIVVAVVLFMGLQNRYLLSEPMGFDKDQLLNVQLNSKIRIDQPDVFISKLKENPFIEEVGFIESAIGESDSFMGWGHEDGKGKMIMFSVLPVTSNYLNVMGIKVSEGRDFRLEDTGNNLGKLIFNETAKKKFDLELGQMIPSAGEIIGFIPDIKFQSFRHAVQPMAFYVWGKENWGIRDFKATVRVKAGADMNQIERYIRSVCQELSPESNFDSSVKPFDRMLKNLYQREYQQNVLATLFSILVIFISIVGVCGLIIFETQARRREIGVCKVFGSSEYQILYLFNKTYIRILLICFVIAIPVAYKVVSVWLQGFAYHIPVYLWVFVVALFIVLLAVSATVTTLSWRTARENPVDSLK